MTINLQYLAIPFWAYALWLVLTGIYSYSLARGGPDILPSLAFFVMVSNSLKAAGLAFIGGLIWNVFS